MERKYALVTSAYNEEKYIANTIEHVLSQTIRPDKWYIISDCSNDGTDDIVKRYSQEYDFICYMRRDDEDKKKHNFASKVMAMNTVISSINLTDFSYIGILDADIIIPDYYYEKLINYFNDDEKLGLIGGSVYETINGKSVLHVISTNTVGGAVQFFRMECFRQMGLFLPLQYGGEDSMMCIKANYHGWKTKTFKDLKTHEQKFVGRSKGSKSKARFHNGKIFYDIGYHPFFMICKCCFRILSKPVLVGSIYEFWGYFSLLIKRTPRHVPDELISYFRKQQMKRLFTFKLLR